MGIVLAVIVIIFIVVLVAFFLVTRSNKSKAPLDIGTVGFDNAIYNTDTGEVTVSDNTIPSAAEA